MKKIILILVLMTVVSMCFSCEYSSQHGENESNKVESFVEGAQEKDPDFSLETLIRRADHIYTAKCTTHKVLEEFNTDGTPEFKEIIEFDVIEQIKGETDKQKLQFILKLQNYEVYSDGTIRSPDKSSYEEGEEYIIYVAEYDFEPRLFLWDVDNHKLTENGVRCQRIMTTGMGFSHYCKENEWETHYQNYKNFIAQCLNE